MTKEDRHLGYATPVGPHPSAQRHSPLALCLIGITAIAGIWSVILGLFYVADWPKCAGPLIGGGVLLCWATVGKLSAPNLRLRSALIILTLAVGLAVSATGEANREYGLRVAKYGYQFNAQAGIRAPASGGERAVAPYEMLRNASLASASLGTMAWLFVLFKLISQSMARHKAPGNESKPGDSGDGQTGDIA